MTNKPFEIKAVQRTSPNLRLLARALLRLVEETETTEPKARKKAS